MTEDIPTIPEFFARKNIFITGGTGFMGKVLIEKLLRSCPDVGKIYILVRPKKGKDPQERIKAVTDLPLFDLLKEEQPKAIEKLVPILGDVVELGLGLSEHDRNLLINEVNIIYHAAASVRFDDPLQDAIIMNTRGTREVIKLGLQMYDLVSFLHISTTYSHTDKKVIREQLYPAHADWQETIKLAENVDKYTLDILTSKYMGPLPNTYTFTKSLAEHVVYDMCDGKVPAIVFRPSIVISTVKEPMPGWIDNFNGPVGILVASGKGIMRSVYTDPNNIADYIPVDLTIKALIMATWQKAVTKNIEERNKVKFYNASSNKIEPVTMGRLVELGKYLCWDIPLNSMLWYPNGSVTKCWYYHFLRVLFYHLLPALFVDSLLKITGNKPMLIKIHRKIYIANMALEYFILNEWDFINDNSVALENSLLPSDQEAFSYNKDEIDVYNYFRNAMLGGRQYLLKEDNSTLDTARVLSKRMWILSQVANAAWYLIGFYLVFYKFALISFLIQKFNDIHIYLTTID